jgi:hypothetical protein
MIDWPRYFGNSAQIASAVMATVALGGIFYQLQLGSHNAQLANARQVYMSYSDATLRYPELTEPDYDKLKQNRVELARYKNFVGHMLFAYDEMFSIIDDPEWLAAFKVDLPPHMPYLCEENDPLFYQQYYAKMQRLLEDARKQCAKKPQSAP